jgi:hypothetical protein
VFLTGEAGALAGTDPRKDWQPLYHAAAAVSLRY